MTFYCKKQLYIHTMTTDASLLHGIFFRVIQLCSVNVFIVNLVVPRCLTELIRQMLMTRKDDFLGSAHRNLNITLLYGSLCAVYSLSDLVDCHFKL